MFDNLSKIVLANDKIHFYFLNEFCKENAVAYAITECIFAASTNNYPNEYGNAAIGHQINQMIYEWTNMSILISSDGFDTNTVKNLYTFFVCYLYSDKIMFGYTQSIRGVYSFFTKNDDAEYERGKHFSEPAIFLAAAKANAQYYKKVVGHELFSDERVDTTEVEILSEEFNKTMDQYV